MNSDVTKYGFYGRNNVSSNFEYTQTFNLSTPTLNISAYYIASDYIFGWNWTAFTNLSDAVFVANGVQYSFDYMSANGTCQALRTYQWGFSFVLLFTFLITLLVWSIGTYIFWLEAHFALKVQDIYEIPGEYEAVIGLSAAMQQEFIKEGEDITYLKEHQIISRIRRDLKGGTIKNDGAIIQQPQYRFREVIRKWFRRDKWWLGGFMVLTAIWMTSLFESLSPLTSLFKTNAILAVILICAFLSLGALLAMLIGRKTGSRILMLLFCGVLGIIVDCSIQQFLF